LTSLDEVDRTPLRSGTYVLAALGSAKPIFLYCREARCLRDALVSARFGEQRKVSPEMALALYIRTGSDHDKPARDAEVDDIMPYYRCGTVPVDLAIEDVQVVGEPVELTHVSIDGALLIVEIKAGVPAPPLVDAQLDNYRQCRL
jgi:hypothetical protein